MLNLRESSDMANLDGLGLNNERIEFPEDRGADVDGVSAAKGFLVVQFVAKL